MPPLIHGDECCADDTSDAQPSQALQPRATAAREDVPERTEDVAAALPALEEEEVKGGVGLAVDPATEAKSVFFNPFPVVDSLWLLPGQFASASKTDHGVCLRSIM